MNMKKTRIVIAASAAVCLAAALAYFGWKQEWKQTPSSSQVELMSQMAEKGRSQHPDIVFYDGTNAGENPFVTEEQVIEMFLEKLREEGKKQGGSGELPPNVEETFRKLAVDAYRKGVEKKGRIPQLSDVKFTAKVTQEESYVEVDQSWMNSYDGPQTVEALMRKYDTDYGYQGSWVDESFPREEWIRRALDLGVVFRDFADYSVLLQLRGKLARIRREPERKRSADLIRIYGLEDDAKYNAYIDAEILRVVRNNILHREAIRKDPRSMGGIHMGDRIIPTRGNQVHVKITPGNPHHGVVMYGPRDRRLTKEEKYLLKYHGVAPEGIEAVYLDENNEPMPPGSEPMRLDWKDSVAVMSEHERQAELQKTVEFLNSEKVNEMTIVDWMTLADYTGALLDYTDGGRAGVSAAPPVPPAPSGIAAPSKGQAPPPSEQELPRLLPPGVELPESPGRSAEDVDAFFQFLDLHLIENADVPENVRRGLKQRYEAYQMWKDQDRLRRQEPAPPSPPSNEDGDTSDEDDEDE